MLASARVSTISAAWMGLRRPGWALAGPATNRKNDRHPLGHVQGLAGLASRARRAFGPTFGPSMPAPPRPARPSSSRQRGPVRQWGFVPGKDLPLDRELNLTPSCVAASFFCKKGKTRKTLAAAAAGRSADWPAARGARDTTLYRRAESAVALGREPFDRTRRGRAQPGAAWRSAAARFGERVTGRSRVAQATPANTASQVVVHH